MSSGGQIVGGIAGAAIGGIVGGAPGAIYGAQIGLAVGGLLDPPKGPTVEGPRLNDLTVQTSTYGQFIPRTYGTIGLSGNVFWLENNQIKEVAKKKKSGGKGGGSSTTVKTYTYFATFAVGLCEGPIAGVRRIWVGPYLVYDAGSDNLDTIIASNNASSKFTIYLGTDTQQPDPRMQAEMGVANCPAYRGLAYVVVKDLLLTKYGNSIMGAPVKVEVVNSLSTVLPSYFEPLPAAMTANERITFADDNGYQTAEAFAGTTTGPTLGIDFYISKVVFKDYTLSGALIKTEEQNHRILLQDTDNLTYYKSLYISGVKSTSCAYRAAGSPQITLAPGVPLSIYTGSQTPEAFRSYAGGYWWFFSGFKNSRISATAETIYTVTGAYPDSVVVVEDLATGRVYRRWVNSSNANCYIEEIDPEIITVIWQTLLGSNNGGWYSAVFSVNNGVATICGGGKMRSYDVSGSSAVLVSVSPDSPSSDDVYGYASGFVIKGKTAGGGIWRAIKTLDQQAVQLSTIVAAEAALSSLIKPADIDVSGLIDSVTGFKVTATGSIRNAIEPLRGAWPFDIVQSGYQIKATTRGSASVVTIPVGELAIDTQLTESREMDSQLPQNVTVKYIDRDRNYDVNEQRAQRDNTEAVNSLVIDLPVVLSATQSAQVAEKLIRIYVLEKSDFSFVLPAPYRYLEAGDVVTIATDDADYVLRLVSVNYTADGRLECAGRPSSASTYTSIAPGDGGQIGDVTIPLAGSTVGIIIDCPVIDEGLQNAPGFASAFTGYSTGWPGGVLYQTADGGQTWTDLQAFDGKSTAGYAQAPLSGNAGNLIQKGGSLRVSLISGTLESVTEAQMLNGANIAAYGINGRWEIIRFQNATLNGDGTYTLDTFWRGDRGTEWATGLHAANDYFILMTDPDLAFVGMPTDSIGQPRDYRSITVGADIDSATSTSYTYDAVNLETYSGVHPSGTRAPSDLTIKWQRRTRVGGAWRDNVDASLGETSEAYEVDIMSGSTVKRTLTASTPSVLYTSAMQITDFGSNQPAVTVKIYQLSSVVGRGYPLEATL